MENTPEPNMIERAADKITETLEDLTDEMSLDNPKGQVVMLVVVSLMLTTGFLFVTGLVYFGYLLGSR